MARTFGIEIEAYNLTLAQAAAAIRQAGVLCNAERYNHDVSANWKVVTDGSISGTNGFEVVSPILSGEQGLAQVATVMQALTAAGALVNKTCGLHVHVGAADFTLRQFANIAKNYLIFEDFFDAIMPASRRFNNNSYIKSLRARFGDYSHASARKGVEAISRCNTIDEVIQALNGSRYDSTSRYHKLNLTAFWRHQTIEFRQHAGTTDAAKAVNWIQLLVNFVDRAATSRPQPRAATTYSVPASTVFSQFFRCFGVKEQRQFFIDRRIALAKLEA